MFVRISVDIFLTHWSQLGTPHSTHVNPDSSAHVPRGQGVQERVPISFWLGGRLSTVQSEGEREVTKGKNDIFIETH